MRIVLAVVAAVFSLSACGSSQPASAPAAPVYTDAGAVAAAAHLEQCSTSATGHDFVTEVACGDRAIVLNFDTASDHDAWLANYMANNISGDAAVLTGDRWAIACPQRLTCAGLSSTLGGTLKP